MNNRLKNNILGTVENQLRMNKPKCTKETLERLVASGTDKNRAKEMISAVLLEEMYNVLKNKEPFNEQRYAEQLNRLGNDLFLESETNYENLGMQEILQSIENNYGVFPEGALQQIIRRKDEAIPFLLDILKKVLENPREYTENQDYFGHIYAVYLLAQFRVTEAYPIFIEILKLPEELSSELFGDTVCEAGDRILDSICGGETGKIKELITNTKVDGHTRGAAARALSILVLQGILPREDVIEYYRMLMTGGLADKNGQVIADVVSSANNLYPAELMEEIRAAHQNESADESYIDLEFVEDTLALGKEWVLEENKQDVYHQFIDDTIEELQGWTCFQEDSFLEEDILEDIYIHKETIVKDFKIGRNDPCPCGSGKKYKKCCGK